MADSTAPHSIHRDVADLLDQARYLAQVLIPDLIEMPPGPTPVDLQVIAYQLDEIGAELGHARLAVFRAGLADRTDALTEATA